MLKSRFDLKQLEIFCKVAEMGTVTAAVEVLFLAQQTVSYHINTLERQVGVKLFDRQGRRMKLTRAGTILLNHAQSMLRQREHAEQELSDYIGGRTGSLIMGASTIPGQYILPLRITDFNKVHPCVEVKLQVNDSGQVAQAVLDGVLEMGIVGTHPHNRDLRTRRLWHDDLVVIVSSGHFWAKKQSVSVEDFLREPFVSRESGSGTRKTFEQFLRTQHINPVRHLRVSSEVGSTEAVKQMVVAGGGVSIISSMAVAAEVQLKKLHVLRLRGHTIRRDFYRILRVHSFHSPLCRAFSDFLEA